MRVVFIDETLDQSEVFYNSVTANCTAYYFSDLPNLSNLPTDEVTSVCFVSHGFPTVLNDGSIWEKLKGITPKLHRCNTLCNVKYRHTYVDNIDTQSVIPFFGWNVYGRWGLG